MLVRSAAALMLVSVTVAAAAPLPPETVHRVDEIFARWDRSDSPGCALGVFQDGRILYARGYGMANLELGVATTPETVFDIGSTSKQFTAMAIFLLARDGKLSIDDDIRRYLPEIRDYGHLITIRHLLNHTSGLRDYLELLGLEGFRDEDFTTDDDALATVARQKHLNFVPGSEHLYCNTGYFLLSIIVKRVSGKSLREFAHERIFEPLGMTHTQINDSHTRIVAHRATGYDRSEDGFGICMSDYEQTGDGSVITSVEDLLAWDSNFYAPRVGDAATLAQMQTPGQLTSGAALTYAAGLVIEPYRGLRTVSHGGAWAGYRAELLRFPGQHFSVAVLCNLGTMDPERLARQVAEVFLEKQMESERPAKGPAPQTQFLPSRETIERQAGTYQDAQNGVVWRVRANEGRLMLETDDGEYALKSLGSLRFHIEDAPVEAVAVFETPESARHPTMIVVIGEKERYFHFVEPWIPARLADYAGVYRSDEIEAPFRFEVREGALYLRHRGAPPQPLKALAPDRFTLESLRFAFERNAKKAVAGFTLDMGRVRGILFRRD